MNWYKIVEKHNNQLKTLFHGVNRSRKLETGKWLKAEIKLVKDGTSKTKYLSGWHIAPSYEECQKYLQFFKNKENKMIIECDAKNIRPKSHSRGKIFLAEYIYIKDTIA